MNLKLSDNIRASRKARSMTQEQLAEALGVTVGAVYKWEAKLSTPDIHLIVALADLFDTSVDALLGYEARSNRERDAVARLTELMHNKDTRGLSEADKALARYPNSFDVVHRSAKLYYMFGLMSHDQALLHRSIELMERSILLLGQNTDPRISELSIYIDIAGAYSLAGSEEKALEILKRNNPRGINNDEIGVSLAGVCNRPEEAVSYLSEALVDALTTFVHVVMGYMNVFFKRGDFSSGASILQLALTHLSDWKEADRSSFLDKPCVSFHICLAFAQLELGKTDAARRSLRAARELAEKFDSAPSYEVDSIRFVSVDERQTAFDDLGETAMACIRNAVRDMDSETLSALWKETEHEE